MRILKWCGVTLVALGAAGGAWLLLLPRTTPSPGAAPISPQEAETILEALKPPNRVRPVVAIVGINDATEVTDYLMPFGVLRRADVADVTLLATGPGPVKLFPVLTVEPQATVAAFDAQWPEGADYVIVPAMSRDNDPTVLAWLKSQAAKGATIVGVCAGAKVVAEAGLLDGKRATTHWYYLNELRRRHPAVRYVANRRLVVDKGVATTTGISASLPMALTLIEAIAGREKAQAVGRSIGVPQWDARHDSGAFRFTRPFAMTAIGNTAAFWNRERLGIKLTLGIDEVSLALAADAWTRTYRSRAITFSATDGAQRTAQRRRRSSRPDHGELARANTASSHRRAPTGPRPRRHTSGHRRPLRRAHRGLRRNAARIPAIIPHAHRRRRSCGFRGDDDRACNPWAGHGGFRADMAASAQRVACARGARLFDQRVPCSGRACPRRGDAAPCGNEYGSWGAAAVSSFIFSGLRTFRRYPGTRTERREVRGHTRAQAPGRFRVDSEETNPLAVRRHFDLTDLDPLAWHQRNNPAPSERDDCDRGPVFRRPGRAPSLLCSGPCAA